MNDYIKTFKLIEKKFKRKFYFTNFLVIIGLFLELISIGLIIPVFYFISDIQKNIGKVNDFFGYVLIPDSFDKKSIIFIIFFLFLIVYVIKSFFLTLIFIYSKRFCNDHEQYLSENVYNNYINSDFLNSIKNDEAIKFRNIHEVAAHSLCLQSMFVINQELLTFFVIFLIILFINIKIGLILFLTAIFLIICFHFLTKKKLNFLGEKKRELESQSLRNTLDALNSLKEIKIFQTENFFLNEFRKIKTTTLNNQFKIELYSFYPRLIIEILVLSASMIYFVYMFAQINIIEFNIILSQIVFSIMGAFRILPGLNRIIINAQTLRKNLANIKNIYNEKLISQNKIVPNYNEDFSFNESIKFNNVSFGYNKNLILENINFKIKKGDIVGLVGSSGSGKTTFINLCLGLIKPLEGKIIIDGKYDLFENSKKYFNKLGFVPQKTFMQNTSVTKNIAFGLDEEIIDESKINELIEFCNLKDFIKNKKDADNLIVGDNAIKISGGQAQRIGIARSIYKDPEILIFDEATNNLDEKNEKNIILKLIKKFKKKNNTFILASHNLDLLKNNCDYILKFERGNIRNLTT